MKRFDEETEFCQAEITSYYHCEFVKALKTFGHLKAFPTLLDLNIEVLRNSVASIVFQIMFLPLLFTKGMNSDELVLPKDKQKSLQIRKTILNSPDCKKLFQKFLKSWLEKGYLEGKIEN
jgi:hypothetical protein